MAFPKFVMEQSPGTTFFFVQVRGGAASGKERIELIERPGIPGAQIQKFGIGGATFPLYAATFAFFTLTSQIKTFIDDYLLLKGEPVTYTNDLGVVFPNLIVMEVSEPNVREVVKVVGSNTANPTHYITVRFTCKSAAI